MIKQQNDFIGMQNQFMQQQIKNRHHSEQANNPETFRIIQDHKQNKKIIRKAKIVPYQAQSTKFREPNIDTNAISIGLSDEQKLRRSLRNYGPWIDQEDPSLNQSKTLDKNISSLKKQNIVEQQTETILNHKRSFSTLSVTARQWLNLKPIENSPFIGRYNFKNRIRNEILEQQEEISNQLPKIKSRPDFLQERSQSLQFKVANQFARKQLLNKISIFQNEKLHHNSQSKQNMILLQNYKSQQLLAKFPHIYDLSYRVKPSIFVYNDFCDQEDLQFTQTLPKRNLNSDKNGKISLKNISEKCPIKKKLIGTAETYSLSLLKPKNIAFKTSVNKQMQTKIIHTKLKKQK